MKRFTLIVLGFCLCLLPLISFAQKPIPLPTFPKTGKGYDDFTPKDWSILMIDSGDLNNDLYEDYTIIYEADKDYLNTNHFDTKFNGAPRVLVILFGRGTDSIGLELKADSAILRANGGEGDPLTNGGSIHTDGNVFEINYMGGVTVQWTAQYRFAYRNKEFVLQTYKGTEYNTNDEDAPIKTTEVEFIKKYIKQDKVKTPLPSPPKILLEKFTPKRVEVIPGVIL
jgi:hypothetical protein